MPPLGRTLEQVLEQKGFADRFIAKGRAEGKRDTIVAILRRRFKRVPKALETAVRQLNDPVVPESFAVEAAVCNSLADFKNGLK